MTPFIVERRGMTDLLPRRSLGARITFRASLQHTVEAFAA